MTTAAAPSRSRTSGLAWIATLGLATALLLPLANAWHTATDLGHGWLAPILLAYLWWERWGERPTLRPAQTRLAAWTAGFIALAGLLVPVRLLLTPYPFWPVAVTLFCGLIVAGALTLAALLAGRAGVRWLGAPLVLLLAAVPWPGFIENTIIFPLRSGMAALAAEICNLIGRPAIAVGTSIQLSSGWVGIDEACGGIRSLQACVLVALFFGEWLQLSLGRRTALVLAGVGAAIAGNFGRVLFLSLRGSHADIASAHDLAGWTALALSVVLTLGLACHWAGYRLPVIATRAPQDDAPANPAIWRVAALFALLLLGSEVGTRLWFARGQTFAATQTGWTVRFPTALPSFQTEPLSEIARDLLRPDFYAAANWRDTGDEVVSSYYIEWRTGQVARAIPFLHNPTVCLPMAGCELVSELPAITVPVGSLQIPLSTYRFRRVGRDMLVAFVVWDPLEARPLRQTSGADTWTDWFMIRWRDVLDARQHQPAQLFAIAISWRESSAEDLQKLLSRMLTPTTDYKIN